MIDDYASEVSSETGYIGENVSIINTGTIKNVCIGDCCIINGTSKLENGTVNSNSTDPVTIGCNVMADDFIISSGSHYDVLLDKAALSAIFFQHTILSFLVIVKVKTVRHALYSQALILSRCTNQACSSPVCFHF